MFSIKFKYNLEILGHKLSKMLYIKAKINFFSYNHKHFMLKTFIYFLLQITFHTKNFPRNQIKLPTLPAAVLDFDLLIPDFFLTAAHVKYSRYQNEYFIFSSKAILCKLTEAP